MIGYKKVKRLLDIVLSLVLIISLLPLTIFVFLLIVTDSKLLFKQTRIGIKNQVFTIFKIRSMYNENAVLLNSVGSFLRKSSIDELPQVWNILKGEMSFIGPRPLLPEYLPHYSAYQIQRHNILPGVTGLAQIKGLNDLSWSYKFRFDTFYVKKQSFCLDCYIIWKTIVLMVTLNRFKTTSTQHQAPFITID